MKKILFILIAASLTSCYPIKENPTKHDVLVESNYRTILDKDLKLFKGCIVVQKDGSGYYQLYLLDNEKVIDFYVYENTFNKYNVGDTIK